MSNEIRLSLLKNIGASDSLDPQLLVSPQTAEVVRLAQGGGVDFISSLYPLLIADSSGCILQANEAALELLDYPPADLKQKTLSDLILRFDKPVLDLVFKLIPCGRPVVIEALCVKRNTSWFSTEVIAVSPSPQVAGSEESRVCLWLNVVKRQVEHDTGAMSGISGASRAESIEMASVVAGQIAHDFNNLLTPLLAYPELIKHELPADTPVLEYLGVIEKTAEDMQRLTQQLLSLARRGRVGTDVFCINETISQVLSEMRRAFPPEIKVTLDLADTLLNVMGGGDQIRRLVENLVQNAIEAMGSAGTLTVKTENVYLDTPVGASKTLNVGEYVKLTVSDTGPGIAPELRNRIFDPFFTTKKALNRRGAGLGLSIVHGIVRDHKGYIDLESVIGEGSSFHIYFPVSRNPAQKGIAVDLPRGTESVLVVDDDAPQVEVLASLLKLLGYQVTGVTSGEQALALIRGQKQQFDLIVLDMVMDMGLDGLDTFKEVRRSVPDQRVILISGFAKASPRVAKAQELGAGQYLRKPLSVESLARAVRAELDSQPKNRRTAALPSMAKILIVDDDPMIRKLFGMIILGQFPDARIDHASNGSEAVESFKINRYNLIIMDLQMPVRDGREAYSEIDELCRRNQWDIPHVVFCTGFTPPESLQTIIRNNPNHCLIRKPVKAENLLDCVRKLMPS